MMYENKNTAAPVPSVGAGGEQPNPLNTQSITDFSSEGNPFDESFEAQWRCIHMLEDPTYLHTFSMGELYEQIYRSKPTIIDGLLHTGTYIFAGAPKLGKSFLMAQIAYHVSTGLPLWKYPVHKGSVLYLALEDSYPRLQERLYRMFGTDITEKLYLGIYASHLGSGLDKQLKRFVREHEDTKLIIIDTLQKIREASGSDKCSYANDYEVMTKLKQFADSNGICLLLVHHTRKQQSDDKFDMISGTNGLLGAADGAFLLHKEKRTDNTAILDVSGRDQQDQRLYLVRNMEKLTWELEREETELWEEPPDPLLDAIAGFVTIDRPEWIGAPTELADALALDLKPNTLTMKLNISASKLLNDYNIKYEHYRSHTGRKIALTLIPTEA